MGVRDADSHTVKNLSMTFDSTVGLLHLWIQQLQIENSVFDPWLGNWYWECKNTVFSPWLVESKDGWFCWCELWSPWIQRSDCIYWENQCVSGPTLSKPVLFKGQLYFLNSNYLLFGPGACCLTYWPQDCTVQLYQSALFQDLKDVIKIIRVWV